MTTKIIDSSVGVRPTGYTGLGTVDGNCISSPDNTTLLTGNLTSDGSAVQILCGFNARRVKVWNITDGLIWEKNSHFPAADCYKTTVATPAIALDTSSHIVIGTDHSVTLDATVMGTSKVIVFEIEG